MELAVQGEAVEPHEVGRERGCYDQGRDSKAKAPCPQGRAGSLGRSSVHFQSTVSFRSPGKSILCLRVALYLPPLALKCLIIHLPICAVQSPFSYQPRSVRVTARNCSVPSLLCMS